MGQESGQQPSSTDVPEKMWQLPVTEAIRPTMVAVSILCVRLDSAVNIYLHHRLQ